MQKINGNTSNATFVVVPRFNMATLVSLIEPMRVANYLSSSDLYSWEIASFEGSDVEASNGITIREGCQITNYISILTHSSHNSIRFYGKEYRKNTDLKGYIKGSVEIGMYSFVGPHVTIMPNTTIGKGCLVSAYSLLKGDYPDFSIIAGNPATVVGSTKDKDEAFLKEHPELQVYYNEWVNR